MLATERHYIGICWLCDEPLHTGDAGAVVYDAGYAPICAACAERNRWAICTDIGPLRRTPDRWCPWTV